MSDKSFTFNFYGNVGQNIANVEKMEVHMDKDGKIQVMNAENITTPTVQPAQSQQPTALNKVDAAIKAVFDSNLCESADWIAVTRLLQERGLKQPNGLPYDAARINEICGQEVTSANSISRSIMNERIGGRYPNWTIRSGCNTREMPNKLRHYNAIAKIVADILDN